MLSPLTTELLNLTDNWHCECSDPACHKQVSLDPDTARLLLDDKWLVLIVGDCQMRLKGEVVKEGDGFKVYRVE